jgi:hypothetical protein
MKPGDPYYGAAGIVQSLISQLLRRVPQLQAQDFVQRLKLHSKATMSTSFLCGLLDKLILCLPADTLVFCGIDAINIHEGHCYSVYQEFEEVVESLVQLRERTLINGCMFKLIFTCSWNSHKFYKLVPDQKQDVAWIPTRVSQQGGLTSSKWKSVLEKNLKFFA